MTEHEKYLFDLRGYLVVPDALDAGQLSELNALIDAKLAAEVAPDAPNHRFLHPIRWDNAVLNVLDNPRILPKLETILGAGLRLDHEYCDVIRSRRGPIGFTLHGGGTPFDPSQFYQCQNGRIRCGLTVVAYNLHDVNASDGGFGCVPGSHKSQFPYPPEWANLEDEHDWVTKITGKAGTAIIFTEALTHGTLPWNAEHERRTLFFKYSPQPVSWSWKYYNAEDFPEATARQRELLKMPSMRDSKV
jgi:hypothetical protein